MRTALCLIVVALFAAMVPAIAAGDDSAIEASVTTGYFAVELNAHSCDFGTIALGADVNSGPVFTITNTGNQAASLSVTGDDAVRAEGGLWEIQGALPSGGSVPNPVFAKELELDQFRSGLGVSVDGSPVAGVILAKTSRAFPYDPMLDPGETEDFALRLWTPPATTYNGTYTWPVTVTATAAQ